MQKLLIDGSNLKCKDLARLARDSEGNIEAVLDGAARERIVSARAAVEEKVKSGQEVYGTTTGLNVLKSSPAPEGQAKLAQAAGNAGRWGKFVDHYEPGVCRVAWAILANGFAKGTTVVTPYLVDQILLWLNVAWNKNSNLNALLPQVEKKTSLSFADTVAPSLLQFETLAKYEIVGEETLLKRNYDFATGEILALLSNNSFTLAEAIVTVDKFENILPLLEIGTALDLEAEKANPFIVGMEAEEVAQWPVKKEVIRRLRALLNNSNIFVQTPSSIHPYVSLRASTDLLATAWEALANTKGVLEQLINSHQSNPVIVGPWNSNSSSVKIGPVAQFDTTRLFWSLSSLQQAMGCLAVSVGQRSQYRINTDGFSVPQLFNRRMLVFQEASVRDCIVASQVVSPAVGRMNSVGGYDWAAPSAQTCACLSQLYEGLVRVLGVNLVVSSAVIQHKMGVKADEMIGDGCKEMFGVVQAASFCSLEDTEQFSFEKLFENLGL